LGDGSETLVSIETFKADDTTGAGDTFLGGFLAAWRAGEVERAVESGVAAAGALLLRRTEKNMGEKSVG
jgi:sugar/nucleoside kinase (ribokinase family)